MPLQCSAYIRNTFTIIITIQSLTDLSGVNIGIHSNSRDWLF